MHIYVKLLYVMSSIERKSNYGFTFFVAHFIFKEEIIEYFNHY